MTMAAYSSHFLLGTAVAETAETAIAAVVRKLRTRISGDQKLSLRFEREMVARGCTFVEFLEVVSSSALEGFDFVSAEMRCECCGFGKANQLFLYARSHASRRVKSSLGFFGNTRIQFPPEGFDAEKHNSLIKTADLIFPHAPCHSMTSKTKDTHK